MTSSLYYSERTKKILKVTLLGSVSNITLVILKLIVGILGHSSALIAEAINSISDFATDLIALIFIRISGKPQDEDHHYGHGKYETLASVVMAAMMMCVGGLLLIHSTQDVYGLLFLGLKLPSPSYLTLIIALVSLLIKEVLYRYTSRWAHLLKSSALRAKAADHRGDTLALLAVSLGLAGAIFLGEKWLFLEPLAAAVVSIFILRMGWVVLNPAFCELTEESLPLAVEEEIRQIAYWTPRVKGIGKLRTRSIGERYAIELDILVDGSISVTEGHDITLSLEEALCSHFGEMTHITIHVEPIECPCHQHPQRKCTPSTLTDPINNEGNDNED